MTADVATVRTQVRALRDRLGWTVPTLADRSGVNEWTIRDLERGGSGDITLGTLSKLAAGLEVPVGCLLGERPPPLDWPVDRIRWRQVGREIARIQEQLEGVA